MILFNRSDSRRTISTKTCCSSLSVAMVESTWTEPAIDDSGLRISWAIPAARRPMAERRSRWRISFSRRRTSVRSANVYTKPTTSPS